MDRMTKNHTERLASLPGRAFVVIVALLASLTVVASASATIHHPKGGFAVFADCPLSNPEVPLCTIAETTSGEFTVGKKTVPINKPIILQGGLVASSNPEEASLVAAENGETLSKTALPVPGGLLGIMAPEFLPKWLQEIFNNYINEGFTGVTETTELAKPAGEVKLNLENLITESGTALKLPVKVKLSNVFLGNECYVGSSSSPLQLNLTTGETSPPAPNKPIHGSRGTIGTEEGGLITALSGGSLVDNTFSAPEATGCGGIFSFLIDPAVDAELGLPSASGHNAAVLNGSFKLTSAEAVRASE
jgi:hypothetical protein